MLGAFLRFFGFFQFYGVLLFLKILIKLSKKEKKI